MARKERSPEEKTYREGIRERAPSKLELDPYPDDYILCRAHT